MAAVVFPDDFVVTGKELEEWLMAAQQLVVGAEGEVQHGLFWPLTALVEPDLVQEDLIVELSVSVQYGIGRWLV